MCSGDFKKMIPGPSRCHLGSFKPSKPVCLHPSVSLNYSAEHGDPDHYFSGKGKSPGRSPLLTTSKRSCGVPPKEKNAIAYMEGKPIEGDTDLRFVFVSLSPLLQPATV